MREEVKKIVNRLQKKDISILSASMISDDFTSFELTGISHQLTRLARSEAKIVAPAIRGLVSDYKGAANPVIDRFALHAIDATFYENTGREIRRLNIKQLVDKYQLKFGSIPTVSLFRGALEMQKGNRASAFTLFERAASDVSDEHGLSRLYLGAHSVRSDDWEAPQAQGALPGTSVKWLHKSRLKGPICILLASDEIYYQRFSHILLDTIRLYDKHVNVHFHIVNPAEESNKKYYFSDDYLSVSTENYPYKRDFAYFAAVRFYRAAEIMRELDQSLYITDIDNKFIDTVHSILPSLNANACGFRYHLMGEWFPWWAPSGGNVWLRNDEDGRKVAGWLERYILNRFQPNYKFSWWFDQLALNEVRHRVLSEGITSVNLEGVSVARPYEEIAHLKSKY